MHDYTIDTSKGPVRFHAVGEPITAIPSRRYFVTDCWLGIGGGLRRYEVTGPDGHVAIFKTLGEAVHCADQMEAADTR